MKESIKTILLITITILLSSTSIVYSQKESIKDVGFYKNAIYGNAGIGGLYLTATGYYERMITQTSKILSFVKVGIDEEKYKYCDDLSILELIAVGSILTEYNFKEHVASDIAVDQVFLNPSNLKTQKTLNNLQNWTSSNLMRLNEKKTNYILFNRIRTPFTTRLTVNDHWLERKQYMKLLGIWLQEDGGWDKNTKELCKKHI